MFFRQYVQIVSKALAESEDGLLRPLSYPLPCQHNGRWRTPQGP